MVFKVELDLAIDEQDGSIVVQRMPKLVTKAKELGFAIVEAEMEQEEDEDDEEDGEEGGEEENEG